MLVRLALLLGMLQGCPGFEQRPSPSSERARDLRSMRTGPPLRGMSPSLKRSRRRGMIDNRPMARKYPSISTEFIQVQRPEKEGRIRRVIRRIRSRVKNKKPAGPTVYRKFLQFLGWSALPPRPADEEAEPASKLTEADNARPESEKTPPSVVVQESSSLAQEASPQQVPAEPEAGNGARQSTTRWAEIGARKSIRRTLNDENDLKLFQKFMSSAQGVNSLLNLEHIRAYDQLDEGRYRVYCGSFKLLSWYVEPVLDLEITLNEGSCILRTRSCEIQGQSQKVRDQNRRFKARYEYKLEWGSEGENTAYLQTSGDLEMMLQIYTFPFTTLPTSAVQIPGNKLMQALLRYLLPAFLDSLLVDFASWKESQQEGSLDSAPEAPEVHQALR
mmetsp:Transcript_21369/g.52343  ORF Transcript_21369/g.52343 Transcript_21369/m.52343 type:complete len:388 (+) Transcript_21369:224-1387(+)